MIDNEQQRKQALEALASLDNALKTITGTREVHERIVKLVYLIEDYINGEK